MVLDCRLLSATAEVCMALPQLGGRHVIHGFRPIYPDENGGKERYGAVSQARRSAMSWGLRADSNPTGISESGDAAMDAISLRRTG